MFCCQHRYAKPLLNSVSWQPVQDLCHIPKAQDQHNPPWEMSDPEAISLCCLAQPLCSPENELSRPDCSTILYWFQANDLFMLSDFSCC